MKLLSIIALAICFLNTQAFLAPLKTPSRGLLSVRTVASSSKASSSRTQLKAMLGGGSELSSIPVTAPSSVLVADYFSTVDEIARNIGNTPWLQYFIPTAVGMTISLAIVYSLYAAAQPYDPTPRK